MEKSRIINTFTDFGNRKWKDRIYGGNADDKTPEDFDPDTIAIGTAVEREHTNNTDIATEISLDHDVENPDYYDELILSGIADEEDAIDMFHKKRTPDEKKLIIDKIQRHLDREKEKLNYSEEEDDDFEDDFEDFDEDRDDIDIDDEYEMNYKRNNKSTINNGKNNNNTMEKRNIKNYKNFINESSVEDEPVQAPISEQNPPERRFTKENKYKYQLKSNKKLVDKLKEYNFNYYSMVEEDAIDEDESNNFIVIDILNLTYSIVDEKLQGVREIDPSKFKELLENL